MHKKIISLILSGVLLSQISCLSTMAGTADENIEKPYDICDGFPKNAFGQTTDIDCALLKLTLAQKTHKGTRPGAAYHVGPTGEHELYLWNGDQIFGLGKIFKQWIHEPLREGEKHKLRGDLIYEKIFGENSTTLANRMANDVVSNLNYFKDFKIEPAEVEKWIKDFLEGQKYQHNYWEIFGWRGLNPFNYFEYTKMKKDKAMMEYTIAEDLEERSRVYGLAYEQIRNLVANGAYNGKDSLVALLNFEKYNYKAFVYFTDLGIDREKLEASSPDEVRKLLTAFNDKEEL